MKKIIDGKEYKEVKISKIIVNGKEIKGATIPAEETLGSSVINIITEADDEESNEG